MFRFFLFILPVHHNTIVQFTKIKNAFYPNFFLTEFLTFRIPFYQNPCFIRILMSRKYVYYIGVLSSQKIDRCLLLLDLFFIRCPFCSEYQFSQNKIQQKIYVQIAKNFTGRIIRMPCTEHDRLPFSVVFWAPRVFSVPQIMFYYLPIALRNLQSGQTYLQVDLNPIGGCLQRARLNIENMKYLTKICFLKKLEKLPGTISLNCIEEICLIYIF